MTAYVLGPQHWACHVVSPPLSSHMYLDWQRPSWEDWWTFVSPFPDWLLLEAGAKSYSPQCSQPGTWLASNRLWSLYPHSSCGERKLNPASYGAVRPQVWAMHTKAGGARDSLGVREQRVAAFLGKHVAEVGFSPQHMLWWSGTLMFFFFFNGSVADLQYYISFRYTTEWVNVLIDYTHLKLL